MVPKDFEENIERTLDEFAEKRALIGDEIIKVKDVAKRMIDEMFNNLLEKLQAESVKTDATIEERIREMRKYLTSLKEIEAYLNRARSVFGDTSSEKGSYARAF